jgi:hypothetical protein
LELLDGGSAMSCSYQRQETIKHAVKEALELLNVPVPAGKGYPFELPVVKNVLRLYQAQEFLHELDRLDTVTGELEPLREPLQELKKLLDSLLTEETLATLRKLRASASEFARLRRILAEHGATKKNAKKKIKRYKKHLDKHLPAHPQFNAILQRLKTYSKGLYHGYNSSRIPLTNLEIERYFNRQKRAFGRRTGMSKRKQQFLLEGENYLLGSHYRDEATKLANVNEFVAVFKKKRLLLSTDEITWLVKGNGERKRHLRRKYLYKLDIQEIMRDYHVLRQKIRELRSSAS